MFKQGPATFCLFNLVCQRNRLTRLEQMAHSRHILYEAGTCSHVMKKVILSRSYLHHAGLLSEGAVKALDQFIIDRVCCLLKLPNVVVSACNMQSWIFQIVN